MKLPRRTVLWTRPIDLSTECPTSPTASPPPRIFLFHFPLLFPVFFFFLIFLFPFLVPSHPVSLIPHEIEIGGIVVDQEEDTDRGGGSGVKRQEGRRGCAYGRARVNRRESFFERDPLTYRLVAPLLLPSLPVFLSTLVPAFLPPCVCWRAASANS